MSRIRLKPLDDGQNAVDIPLGKTTIGRGSLLPGCSDKKVSRNHAVLEVTSKGEVYLTPTHVNPCFYQPTADSPGQILKKDIPHKLKNGDSFSLLPRAYRYQVIVEGEAAQKESPDQNDSKQSGKTNGSAEDIHEEVATNEELGDTTVPEKAFTKEDASNTEKSNPKEDNTFSKKIVEIKDNGELVKENQESGESIEKDNSPSKRDLVEHPPASASDKEDIKDGEVQAVRTESEANDSSDEGYVDAEEKLDPPVDEVVEKKDTPPEPISESSVVAEEEEKPLAKLSPEILDEKVSEGEESQPGIEPHTAATHDQSSNEAEQEMPVLDSIPTTSKPTRKKVSVPKHPRKERQVTKRKAAPETAPKPRGRKKKSSKINFDDGEEGPSQRPGRTSSRTNRQTRQGLSLEDFIVSDDDEWQSDRSEPKPRRRKRRGDDSGSDWEVDHKKTKKPLHKAWSGSESGSDRGSQRKKGPKGKRRKSKAEPEDVLSDEEEEEPSSSNKVKLDKTRIPCTYGKKCFRRNHNHKSQFSHPGDSDYTSEPETNQRSNDAISESEGDSPKKECPYGVNCFRKNAQHKKDYKHTKKVRPQREAAKQADQKAKSSRNSDEVDSYDLNDSFLNEESADEYKPLDSGSDYESGEKMKRLAKMKGNKSKRGKKA